MTNRIATRLAGGVVRPDDEDVPRALAEYMDPTSQAPGELDNEALEAFVHDYLRTW
ncbi:MAG: hypothetical protein Kow0069_04910 [Promethearchaeota archaeon]